MQETLVLGANARREAQKAPMAPAPTMRMLVVMVEYLYPFCWSCCCDAMGVVFWAEVRRLAANLIANVSSEMNEGYPFIRSVSIPIFCMFLRQWCVEINSLQKFRYSVRRQNRTSRFLLSF